MKFHLIKLCFLCVLLVSCNTSKEIVYFQDIVVNQPEAIIGARDITVQPKDQISIMVSSKDPQLAALFNLTRVQYRAGSSDLRSGNINGEISGYTLDDKGNIDFPVVGTLHIAGMTKSQIATLVKKRLIVIREENGERVTHWVDIRSKDLFNSPVYYLKQNDVVYVQPNKVRAGQSTINENSVKSVSLWISIGSLLSSLGVLLFK